MVNAAVVPFSATGVPAEALSTRKLTLPVGATLPLSEGVTVAVKVSLAFSAGELLPATIVVTVGDGKVEPVPPSDFADPQLVGPASTKAQSSIAAVPGNLRFRPGNTQISREADANTPDAASHFREPVSREADGPAPMTEALVVLIVRMEEPLPLRGFCVKLQVAPLGKPEQLNVTAPLKPPVSVTVSKTSGVVVPLMMSR